jgi:hypothetical protein
MVAVAATVGFSVGDETSTIVLLPGKLQAERINVPIVSTQKSREKALRMLHP